MSGPTGEFRFHHPVEVRFRDIDIGGHAHHSEALIYFEEARASYWREVARKGGLEDVDYVLAEATVRWHRRVLWPQTLSVGVRVNRLGNKSFDVIYSIQDIETGIEHARVGIQFRVAPALAQAVVGHFVLAHDLGNAGSIRSGLAAAGGIGGGIFSSQVQEAPASSHLDLVALVCCVP